MVRKSFYSTAFNLTVLVAGLGYFIDTFDFFLYISMRVPSLTEIGLSGDLLVKVGLIIVDCSIVGAMIGSLFWGALGDRSGRKKALLGSILIYSLGMIANAFVRDAWTYGIVRFLIGFGVAGELGLGATLVAETIESSKRTYALAFFTIMGCLGVAAAAVSLELVSWRTTCLVGGVLGIALLGLRSLLFESQLFLDAAHTHKRRGLLADLFGSWQNLKKFLCCVMVLVPNYFVTGILLALAPEIARAAGVRDPAKADIAIAVYFAAAVVGDMLGAWLSESFKSRRSVAGIYIAGTMALAIALVQKLGLNATQFYIICAAFGLFNLWAISSTIAVEEFPTTLRATASTASLNFSRGVTVFMHLTFIAIHIPFGTANAVLLIGGVVTVLSLLAVWRLPESYGRNLAD